MVQIILFDLILNSIFKTVLNILLRVCLTCSTLHMFKYAKIVTVYWKQHDLLKNYTFYIKYISSNANLLF
jgi:hypothetical protein